MSDDHVLSSVIAYILYHYTNVAPLLLTYIHLVAAALFPIIAGAHASLCAPTNCKVDDVKHDKDQDSHESIDEETGPLREKLSKWDALLFPLTAGVTLLTLYLIITYASADILNKIMAAYMTFMGVFALGGFFGDALGVWTDFVFPQSWGNTMHKWEVKRGRVVKTFPASIEYKSAVPLPYGHIIGRFVPGRIADAMFSMKQMMSSRFTFKATSSFFNDMPVTIDVSLRTFVGYIFSALCVAIYYFWSGQKPWLLTNLLGTSFSYSAIQLLSPSSFPVASLLLIALFFYDIFFVFYTPLMVTVATKLDLPIKLLFPRPVDSLAAPDAPKPMAMLGLGDIVLPGIVIALALRFDLWRHYEKKRLRMIELCKPEKVTENGVDTKSTGLDLNLNLDFIIPTYQKSTGSWGTRFWTKSSPAQRQKTPGVFPRPYFYASCTGYIIGMCITIIVMHTFKHAQPALLYLVPCVLSSLWLTALFKGEIGWFWNWTELVDEDKSKDENLKKMVENTQQQQLQKVNSSDQQPPPPSHHYFEENFKTRIFQQWRKHRVLHPASTNYDSLKVALDEATAPSAIEEKKTKLQTLISEDQEPVYKLIVELTHKEAEKLDNPFVFKEDYFGKGEVNTTSADIQALFVRGDEDMSRKRN